MRIPTPHPAPDERGFILVGVVTFMLALTILGLSLFALSSYEGQFFTASASHEQALLDSESGMELVQALLAAPSSRLETAHQAEGQLGVTSAMAYQRWSGSWVDTTSSGPINWDSTMVVVVSARRGGVVRTVMASFLPTPAQNPYQRLMAAGAGIVSNTENGSHPDRFRINGAVWQPVASFSDTSWTGDVAWDSGRPLQRGAPPPPAADPFVDAPPGPLVAPGSDYSNNNNYHLTFPLSPATPTYFSLPAEKPMKQRNEEDDPQFTRYSFYTGADVTLHVSGTAVWLIPQGVYFKDQVHVVASPPGVTSTLVIVSKANGRDPADPNLGIRFGGGLDIPNGDVRVFLVSQGNISVIHHTDKGETHDALSLSIVAGGRIEIGGPDNSNFFRLAHDPAMDALADELLAEGALPPLFGATEARFVLAHNSWSEITPR
jgi:hypothetical protein